MRSGLKFGDSAFVTKKQTNKSFVSPKKRERISPKVKLKLYYQVLELVSLIEFLGVWMD